MFPLIASAIHVFPEYKSIIFHINRSGLNIHELNQPPLLRRQARWITRRPNARATLGHASIHHTAGISPDIVHYFTHLSISTLITVARPCAWPRARQLSGLSTIEQEASITSIKREVSHFAAYLLTIFSWQRLQQIRVADQMDILDNYYKLIISYSDFLHIAPGQM